MTTLEQAQTRLRDRIHAEQEAGERKRFQAEFSRLVRTSNFQLNVEHKWPQTVRH